MALAATTALLAGGCSTESAPALNDPELQHSLDATLAYWQQLGATGIDDIRLQTITDGSVSCGDVHITNNSISPATLCYSKRTIFISSLSYAQTVRSSQNKHISSGAVAAAVVGHEFGHALLNGSFIKLPEQKEELTADCLAGVAIAATAPDLRGQAGAFLGKIGGGTHGTSEERTASFENGFTNGIKGCGPALPTQLGIPSPSASLSPAYTNG